MENTMSYTNEDIKTQDSVIDSILSLSDEKSSNVPQGWDKVETSVPSEGLTVKDASKILGCKDVEAYGLLKVLEANELCRVSTRKVEGQRGNPTNVYHIEMDAFQRLAAKLAGKL